MQKTNFFKILILFFLVFVVVLVQTDVYAETVELNGDTVEYSVDGNIVTAKGNVEIVYKGAVMTCDEVEFHRDTKKAKAKGDVVLKTETGTISGNNLDFDFETMSGQLNNAKIMSDPYYGYAEKVYKVSDNKILLEDGYITTSDYDDPGYRLTSKVIEIYPKDKIISRSVMPRFGNVPVFYFPRVSQDLKEKGPGWVTVPGYKKDWGMFLLTKKRFHLNNNVKGNIHVDFREKKDIASGIDLEYKTDNFGEGLLRTYYMNERTINASRFWQKRKTPTIERERYLAQWQHKWKIDDKTNSILQYYRVSDTTIIKDYFEKKYREDSHPKTYFLLTRSLPKGILSFRTDIRANRWFSEVERLPEVRYDLSSTQIGHTGIYYKNVTSYSNLVEKTASPSEVRQNTMRVNTDHQIDYPMKIGFIELKPYVGAIYTYYSKTKDPGKYGSIRSILKTGASLSTKFYRIYDDVKIDSKWIKLDRLRHIITPSISYLYRNRPSISADQLDSFDSIDDYTNAHMLTFSLENKLQTKREGNTVDILRAIVSSDFALKENPSSGGFANVKTDIDFKPVNWLTFYFDSTYDTQKDHLSTANFDLYINGGNKWSLGIGKRYNREVDDQITTNFNYVINPKWDFTLTNWFDLDTGTMKEQYYTIRRDLHSWDMEISFREQRSEGNEIVLYFTLKAFPDMGIDMGTSFNKRKRGSQPGD